MMTKTYFIRHSSALDVDAKTLQSIWDDDYVGIHYPRDTSGTFDKEDSSSLDPTSYAGTAKSSLERLCRLASAGGYVFAAYRGQPGAKIGYVKPDSAVELFSGRWGAKNNREGMEARLKVIKLDKAKNLSAEESISMKAVQPRQGTFCCWTKVGRRVEAMLNGISTVELGGLTPDLQEVMCMEFLRSERARAHGLPVLRHTLVPVGRTLKDLDIFGVSESGRTLAAQVTYHKLGQADWKLRKLDHYSSSDTVYFCRCDHPDSINGHIVFPIELVFKEFCESDEAGARWFRLAAGAG